MRLLPPRPFGAPECIPDRAEQQGPSATTAQQLCDVGAGGAAASDQHRRRGAERPHRSSPRSQKSPVDFCACRSWHVSAMAAAPAVCGAGDRPHGTAAGGHERGGSAQDLADAGTAPSIAMLQRCVERAERAGDREALQLLMARLDMQNYKIIGAAAKVRPPLRPPPPPPPPNPTWSRSTV